MDLNAELKKLIELQKFDSEIYNIRQDIDVRIPEQLKEFADEIALKKQALQAAEESFKKSQLLKKERELELAAKEEGVQKAQGQLYQLKNNKEYQAKLNEISSLKADVSIFEEEVLKSIEEIEKTQAGLNEAKDTFLRQEKEINEKTAEVQARAREFSDKLGLLEDKRSIVLREVDPEVLKRYERLLIQRSGVAITHVDPSESCGYCHMRITAQRINEIQMRKDLVFCDSCNRILYLPEDMER